MCFLHTQSLFIGKGASILVHFWFNLNGCLGISAMLKVPDGTFSWKWFKSLAQRSDLNLVGSTWPPK